MHRPGSEHRGAQVTKNAHIDFVGRRENRKKTKLSKDQHEEYISLVIHGSDQTKFSLPKFVTQTNDKCCHGLRIHLIGVLEHAHVRHLRLFTMTEYHENGSSHIVEAIHKVLNDKE